MIKLLLFELLFLSVDYFSVLQSEHQRQFTVSNLFFVVEDLFYFLFFEDFEIFGVLVLGELFFRFFGACYEVSHEIIIIVLLISLEKYDFALLTQVLVLNFFQSGSTFFQIFQTLLRHIQLIVSDRNKEIKILSLDWQIF